MAIPSGLIELFSHDNYLVMGCGGGYDIFAGYFLIRQLLEKKKNVVLANYSFTDKLHTLVEKDSKHPWIVKVTGETKLDETYFPEQRLAQHLDRPVYAIRCVAPCDLIPDLQVFCDDHKIQHIILVDAGSDALLYGDESDRCGTPCEDMVSMVSVASLNGIVCKWLLCLSVPTEDIPLPQFLHNVSRSIQAHSFLGAVTQDLRFMSDYEQLLEPLEPAIRTIPNECILAGMKGCYAELHFDNPRLHHRILDLSHAPPVNVLTFLGFYFDIQKWCEYSPLMKELMAKGRHTTTSNDECQVNQEVMDFNRLIRCFLNVSTDDDDE